MIQHVIVPTDLLKQVEDEAHAACPRECCGLLIGEWRGHTAKIFLAHPAVNIAEADDRFEIDPQAQFTLLRALRGTAREIVGCYHSHPNGRAEPSERDGTGAAESGFLWLICALDTGGACTIGAFVFDGGAFRPVPLIESGDEEIQNV